MVDLSHDELGIIETYCINDGLHSFRATFNTTFPDTNAAELWSRLLSHDGKNIVLKLIVALQNLTAALFLRSRIGNGPLIGDISSLIVQITSNTLKIEDIAHLMKLVLTKAEDAEIWSAIFNLVARTKPILQPTTPPSQPSFTSSFQQTPWSFNTGNFADTSEHRNQVDDALKEELLPSLRLDIPDLVHAVFGQVPRLDELAEEVFDTCQEGDAPLYIHGSGWTKWPPSAKEELVLEWLQSLMARFMIWVHERGLHPTHCRWIYQGPGVYLDGSTAKRKMDVGITAHHGQSKRGDERGNEKTDIPISDWAQILVAGQLKSNPIEDGQTPAWLDLATYAREVFRTQDRRFILGFTLCGSMMRLWQFDRSGSSGSSSFDINEDGFKFTHVMLGYFLMNDKQLGLDPTIQQSDGKRYVEVTRNGQVERLILTQLIKTQAVIAGRATTCWKAYRDGDELKESLIVKDSWQYEQRPEEGELIKEATDKGVRNVARYYHHETVQVGGKNDDTIENVRRGLMKTCGRTTFRQKSFIQPEIPASESLGKAAAGRTQSRSLSRKRSSNSTHMAPPPTKRSCSSLRSRSSGILIHNRVRRRVVTLDSGKTIQKASSRLGIIHGFIGAINGLESLVDAGILHRDPSIGNITVSEKEEGTLIDLDLAIKTRDIKASGAPSKTGTKVFMSIGGLLGEDYNLMQDLESLFWDMFWICIHCTGPDGKSRRSEFEDWNFLSTERLAKEKAGQVSKGIFDNMDIHVTAYCKPLIPYLKELHEVCFPGGVRWLKEDRGLYSQMKAVFEKAREDPKILVG